MTTVTAAYPNRSFSQTLRQVFAAWPGPTGAPSARGSRQAPAATEQLQRELRVIRAYASFVSQQTDMPADHRERFLGHIVVSCDRALAKLTATEH